MIYLKNSLKYKDIKKLEEQKEFLNNRLNSFKLELNSIAQKKEYSKYSYITFNDLKDYSTNNEKDLFILKAAQGSIIY